MTYKPTESSETSSGDSTQQSQIAAAQLLETKGVEILDNYPNYKLCDAC